MAFNFLKTGAASVQMAQQAQVESELAQQQQGKAWRFFVKEGEKALITFVDGDLNEQGFLAPPRYYEHHLYLNGKWGNFFVCPEKTNPEAKDICPICKSGDRPALVALFTIIDHREFTSKDKTKKYKDTKKSMPVKPNSFELLNHQAIKRGGLAGATFEVIRQGDKAPSIGSSFDFEGKKPVEECKKLYVVERIDPTTNKKVKETNFTPFDYEKEIEYRTGEQLTALGLFTPPGGSAPAQTAQAAPADYANHL